MIPFNALATEKLDIPYLKRIDYNSTLYTLPPARYVQLKASNELAINRAILNLITVPNLIAAHIFRFDESTTHWTLYENKEKPLAEHEVRGAMVLAMQQVKQNTYAKISPVTTESRSFIRFKEPIINELKTVEVHEKVFIILVFKEYMLVTGNYYDETTLCRALLKYRPRKAKKVIRKATGDVYNERHFSFVQQHYLAKKQHKDELYLLA